MAHSDDALRLNTASIVRSHQREWLADARARAEAGEPFAICSSDEFEEIFTLLDIPVLVVNYWNYLTLRQGLGPHFTKVLEDRGYPGPHFFGIGLATAMDPANAPWGGLPKPSIIVGSTRTEYEGRISELWAREMGCEFYPMEFNMQSPPKRRLPADWYTRTAHDWEAMLDPDRLEFRIQQNYALIAHLEQKFGRSFDHAAFVRSAELENEQMGWWEKTHQLIAGAERCPVSLRDQLAMYQPMWHRGTQFGADIFRTYHDEVAKRVANGQGGYANESKRLIYWSMSEEPAFHGWLNDRYGAVFVGNQYSSIPNYYIREFDRADPMRAMAGRHLFLFGFSAALMIEDARLHRADGIVVIGPPSDDMPSDMRQASEDAGIPFLELPTTRLDDINRERLDRFMQERLGAQPAASPATGAA